LNFASFELVSILGYYFAPDLADCVNIMTQMPK